MSRDVGEMKWEEQMWPGNQIYYFFLHLEKIGNKFIRAVGECKEPCKRKTDSIISFNVRLLNVTFQAP
jgi:hypothetical protein